MDEFEETALPSAGEQLRAAREEKGISLEDIAAQTRIPRRHLESLESGDWSKLPAPTYSIGFARSYATIVGLDRTAIGDQLRGEMGGQRPLTASAEVFEPADPARTMPKWLVFGGILAVIALVVGMSWLNRRSLADDSGTVTAAPVETAAPATATPPPTAAPAAQGPVIITATQQVWIQVKDGATTLKEVVLEPGQTYAVPTTASAPMLATAKAEALRISVGTATAPAIGPPATKLNVSLLGADLMRGPAAASASPATAPPASAPPLTKLMATPATQ